MKKIFFFLLLVITVCSNSFAQQLDKNFEAFLLQKFPEYLPSYVVANATQVAVTKKMTKRKYNLFDIKKDAWTQGKLRIGDTVVVFNDKPFFAIKQRMFIGLKVGKEKNKTSRIAQKTPRAPRQRKPLDPQVVQVGVQFSQQVLSGVLWKIQTRQRF